MRYLPNGVEDRKNMLEAIGASSIDELFSDVPESAHLDSPIDLPGHKGEMEVERIMKTLASQSLSAGEAPFFIGGGAYKHHVPSTVDHLIQRSEFLTSYTPYQPESSQGVLQTLFEFQTQVALLTGMDVANASMYDGSTACAEAVQMAFRLTRRRKAILSGNLHPQYAGVVKNLCTFAGDTLKIEQAQPKGGEDLTSGLDAETACVVVQYPDFFGHINDFQALADAVHEAGALLIVVVTEIVSLGALKAPGDMGADIVVGEGQSIGNGLNFGGPYVGLFATRQKFVRQMPGRLCGQTVDGDGRRGFVLTLSTREQHIRREKATSNICTNSGLCALSFTIHLTLLGEKGLRALAATNHANAVKLANTLEEIDGVSVINESFFNEFTVQLPKSAAGVVEALADKQVLGGIPVSRLVKADGVDDLLLVASTEVNTQEDMQQFQAALKEVLS